MSGKKVLRVVVSIVIVLLALVAFYTVAIMPVVEKGQRAACHANYAAEAQQYGQQVVANNQDNPDITEAELNAQVSQLVQQRYETNYILCLRSMGL